MPNRRRSHSLAALAALISAFSAVSASAQSNDGRTKPTGSISGTVSINDKGASDILVMAQFGDRPSLQQAPTRTKTDTNGRYQLTGLAAGQYQVSAVAPALTLAESGSTTNNFFGMGKLVVLTASESVDDIDIKLVKGAVISGRITDADDRPVVEQRVNLQLLDSSGNPTRQFETFMSYQMSVTDDRGIYRIYGLPAGRYRVSVGSSENAVVSGNPHAVYPLTFYGATNDPIRAAIVELQEGGDATNIDIRVGRAGNSYVASGRLIDADTGQSIPGVRIMYGPVRAGEQFYGGMIGMPTGSRGEFRLEGLERGRYAVSISTTFDASSYYSEPVFFNITDNDITNLELKATRGQTLSGVVVFEGSRAKELQQQFSVLRIVANISSPSNVRAGASSSGPLAGNGTFQIGGVQPGRVNLYVAAYSNSALWGVTILRVERGGIDVTKGFDLQPGESISDLRVTAALGAGIIRGTVRITGGELPANARLTITARRDGGTGAGNGLVDARGRFAISNLISGTYEVVLIVNLNPPGPQPIPPQRQTVNVSDDSEAQVDFILDLTPKEGGP